MSRPLTPMQARQRIVRGDAATAEKVRRAWFWAWWDNDGAGDWRLLPVDRAHQASVIVDPANSDERIPLYEWKGFVPEHKVTDEAALKKLAKLKAEIAASAATDQRLAGV